MKIKCKMTVTGIFLNLVHFFITLHTLVFSLFAKIRKPWPVKWKPSAVSYGCDRKSFSKLPLHLGLVVVEEDLSYFDLAKIAAWCMIIGISHISIYDRKGVCKRNKDIFSEQLSQYQKRILPTTPLLADKSVQVTSGIIKPENEAPTSKGRLQIRLLSMQDGRQHLVDTARELSRAVMAQSVKLSELDPCSVDTILQDKNGFPDPDLVIRFGATESLLGYLPWQIRLSEILSLPSHKHIEYQSFHDVLQSYADTTQRFGK